MRMNFMRNGISAAFAMAMIDAGQGDLLTAVTPRRQLIAGPGYRSVVNLLRRPSFDNVINRWTGKPHEHNRANERRAKRKVS